MVVSPHCGQGNFTAPSRGSIMRPHQLQLGIRTVRTSVNISNRKSNSLCGLYAFAHDDFTNDRTAEMLTLFSQALPHRVISHNSKLWIAYHQCSRWAWKQ